LALDIGRKSAQAGVATFLIKVFHGEGFWGIEYHKLLRSRLSTRWFTRKPGCIARVALGENLPAGQGVFKGGDN